MRWHHDAVVGDDDLLRPFDGRPEFGCTENAHEYYAQKDSAVPTADRPDFWVQASWR